MKKDEMIIQKSKKVQKQDKKKCNSINKKRK